MNTKPLQGDCRAALRVPCRTKLRLEHVSTGQQLHGQGVDISISGMHIRVSDEDAQHLKPGDELYLRIDPEEEDYFEALDTLSLSAKIIRIWTTDDCEGLTDIGIEFVYRLMPKPTPDDAENLH